MLQRNTIIFISSTHASVGYSSEQREVRGPNLTSIQTFPLPPLLAHQHVTSSQEQGLPKLQESLTKIPQISAVEFIFISVNIRFQVSSTSNKLKYVLYMLKNFTSFECISWQHFKPYILVIVRNILLIASDEVEKKKVLECMYTLYSYMEVYYWCIRRNCVLNVWMASKFVIDSTVGYRAPFFLL